MMRTSAISRRRWITSCAWLTFVWVMLWGTFSFANVLSGLIVAILINLLFVLPSVDVRAGFHPIALAKYLGHLAVDMSVASVQVAWQAIKPRLPNSNAVVSVQLQSPSDLVNTITVETLSLIPGSIVIEFVRSSRTIYAHVWGIGDPMSVIAFRRKVLRLERRIAAAIDPRGME
jgi:multicomponent Na+:H+ antiporter subunit E